MTCQKCGAQLGEDAAFCPYCGSKVPVGPVGTPTGAAPKNGSKPNETPSKFALWWAHAQMVEKVFFILGIAVVVIVAIALLVNFWKILVGVLVIAGVITAFVTGSKEERSEIRPMLRRSANARSMRLKRMNCCGI